MLTSANTRPMISVLQRCMLFLLIGIMLSFMIISVFAVYSDNYYFSYGTGEYFNFSRLTISGTTASGETSIYCSGGTGDSDLGVINYIYKETSSGTYSLVDAGWWAYNYCTMWTEINDADNLSSGNYIAQGQTAVYYDGSYQS